MNIALLGLFGLLLFGVVCGVIWGAIRGTKRSAFRLATVIVFLVIAFFLTPLFAGLFANVPVPGVTDGVGLRKWLVNELDLQSVSETFPELAAVIQALPAAIIGVLVFLGLYIIFRFLSWIVYVILAIKLAPRKHKVKTGNKTANGMDKFQEQPVKVNRWGGALIGALQGFILFFFLMIPVNGVMATINTIDNYSPSFTSAEVRVHDENITPLSDVFYELSKFNSQVQRSPFGIATRFTGMQLLGGPMLGYLTTIRPSGHANISLRADIIRAAEVHHDIVAIWQNFFDEEGNELDATTVLKNLSANYYNGMRQVIRKIFNDIGIARMAFNSAENFAKLIQEEGWLDDFEIYSIEDAEDEERARQMNNDFNNAVLAALSLFNTNLIRDDLVRTVDIIEILFRYTTEFEGNRYNLYEGFQGIWGAIGEGESDEAVQQASDRFAVINANQPTSVNRLFTRVFELSLFTAILNTQNQAYTADLIQVPLMIFLDLSREEAAVQMNWANTATQLANAATNGINAFVGINQIFNADYPLTAIANLEEGEGKALESVGNFLNIISNDLPFSQPIRSYIANFLDEIEAEGLERIALDNLSSALRDGGELNWHVQLETIRQVIIIIDFIDRDEGTLSDLLYLLFVDADFLIALRNDPILGPMAVDMLSELINENLEGTLGDYFAITFNAEGRHEETIDALIALSTGMYNIITILDGSQALTGDQFVEAFGEDDEALRNVFDLLVPNEEGSLITIGVANDDQTFVDAVRNTVRGLYSDDQDRADNILLHLFGIPRT